MEISEKTVLTNSWYAKDIYPKTKNFDEYLQENYADIVYRLATKSNFIKNCLLFVAGRKFDIIIAPISEPGVYYFLMLESLFSLKKNRVIILEFIRANPQNKLLNLMYPLWVKHFFGPILQNTLLRAQVLTTSEISKYANQFGVAEERFCFIPWPLHFNKLREPEVQQTETFVPVIQPDYVMVSGLGNVDWETIFDVAEHSNWQLLAVCSKKHLQRVTDLNKSKKAKILNDISQYDHAQYVKNAKVYALCLQEYNVSVGQIRLMNTIEHGVPVVATDVAGLRGYAVNGVNALMVPANNAIAFKTAIDTLMNDEKLRTELITSARHYQTNRTFQNYIHQISLLVARAAEGVCLQPDPDL